MTALEYLNTEWSKIDRRIPDYDRRAAWERIVEMATQLYGHADVSRAIVDHVNSYSRTKR